MSFLGWRLGRSAATRTRVWVCHCLWLFWNRVLIDDRPPQISQHVMQAVTSFGCPLNQSRTVRPHASSHPRILGACVAEQDCQTRCA